MTSSPATIGVQVVRDCATSDHQLSLHDGDTSLAEVLDALGLPHRGIRIDGQVPDSPTVIRALDQLAPGSRIVVDRDGPAGATAVCASAASGPGSGPGSDNAGVVEVSVVAGLASGPLVRLPPGRYHMTPDDGDSGMGWCLEIVDRTAGPGACGPRPWQEHGVTVEAIDTSGFVVAVSGPVDPEPGPAGFVHRPPRSVSGVVVPTVELAEPPPPISPPAPLSWATMLAPVPIALLMMVFFRPIFALFAAMGPVLALARWYEGRRRYRRTVRDRDRQIGELRFALQQALDTQAEGLARLRWVESPHVPELWRRARSSSVRLWERRLLAPGFGCATIGIAPDRVPPVTLGTAKLAEVYDDLLQPVTLRPVPHLVDLTQTRGVGLHGPRSTGLAVARSILLQLATLHGPCDLRIGVVCSPDAAVEWDWLKWLPHHHRRLTGTDAALVAREIHQRRTTTAAFAWPKDQVCAMQVLVVDDVEADVAAIHRSAQQSGHDVRFVVVANELAGLPAVCDLLVAGSAGRDPRYVELSRTDRAGSTHLCPTGITRATAASWARSLAAVRDPELVDLGDGESKVVGLGSIMPIATAAELSQRWAVRSAAEDPVVALGARHDGVFMVNLTKDGPHALIAGTTGSGKSELLRTLVVGLAAACPPDHLSFVLVDFKGGGAFDACARLPHVAGLLTDLDETTVSRAILSLRAELQRRESIFRSLGVNGYEAAVLAVEEPLPRVVIVIDEFAALATEYGEMMAAIVDLAARGRSLGMHLVLATQRPSGVVDQKIRANTNLKVVLRVQDAFDSHDMIGTPEAAGIDRGSPGRALCAIGGDPAVLVQTAYCGGPDRRGRRCVVRPHRLIDADTDSADGADGADELGVDGDAEPTELEVLVDMIAEAGRARGYRARALWSEPLPARLDWIDLGTRLVGDTGPSPDLRPVGLVDLPDQQTQQPWFWDLDNGGLAVYGSSADSCGKILVSVGAAITSGEAADRVHLYLIDGDSGRLAALAALPHTGAYLTVGEIDRIDRTVQFFAATLDARRGTTAQGESHPRLVLMLDNVASVLAAHDDLRAASLADRLGALARDGSPHRIHLVLSSRTARDIPHRLAQQLPHRLVLALADPSGYLTLGLTAREVPALPDMRAIDLRSRRVVQLVEPPDLAGRGSAHGVGHGARPMPIHAFPSKVSLARLSPARLDRRGVLVVPVGVEARGLGEAILELHPGEHALIVAPPGAGRSTALMTILTQLARGLPEVALVRIAPSRSPLAGDGLAGVVASTAAAVDRHVDLDRQVVLIVDDADHLDPDMAARLEDLLGERREHVRLVVATTPESARGLRSWSAKIRASATGIVLAGGHGEADLFRTRLEPIAGLGTVPGRGHVVCRGQSEAAQIADIDH